LPGGAAVAELNHMNVGRDSRLNVWAGFAVLLLLPSFDVVLKYTGIAGLAAYSIFGLAGLYIFDRYLGARAIVRLREKPALIAAFGVFVFLAVIAALVYPIANSGRFGGGSDIDDAMLIGAREILAGRYPYYPKTYLGGYLSPMPGTILLSVPFVAAGLLPFQNVFWVAILFFTARTFLKSSVLAFGIVLTPVVTSPSFYQVLVTGSDHTTNTIFVLVAMWSTVKAVSEHPGNWWKKVLGAVCLGFCLSSRSVFLLLVPLHFSALWQASGFREALKYTGLTIVVFAAVTVPFYLYDPAGFSPLIVQAQKTAYLESVLPNAGLIIAVSTFLFAVILSLQKLPSDCSTLFRNCALVQLFMLVFASTLWIIYSREFTLYLGTIGYGMFTLFFASAAAWISIGKRVHLIDK
jgi:hypothetical protein